MLSFPIKTSTVDINDVCTNAIELVQTSIVLSPLKLYVLKCKLTLIQITNLTSESNICEAAPVSFFLGPQQAQQITGNSFRISLQPGVNLIKVLQV